MAEDEITQSTRLSDKELNQLMGAAQLAHGLGCPLEVEAITVMRICQETHDARLTGDGSEQFKFVKMDTKDWLTWADDLTGGKHYLLSAMRREIGDRLKRLEVERDELARAIAEAAIARGIITGTQPLTGPQLLLICQDLGK